MASVPILSTGRDTAVYLDNSQVNRSAEKLNSEVLGAETMKLNKALKDKDTFMKMMDVDPVTLISQGATKLQAERQQEFNNKWAKEMQKSKGQLTMDKEIEMRQDRLALEGWQKRMGANQQRYLQELQMYRSNPSKYDSNAFTEATAQLYSTGEYESGLQPKGGRLFKAIDDDLTAYWRTKPATEFVGAKGKDGQIVKTTAAGSTEAGRQRLLNLVLSDEGYLKDLVQDFWANAPDEEKVKYFDSNKDGKVTEEEVSLAQSFGNTVADIAKNPIMQWGLDKYSQKYRRTDAKATNPPSGSGSGSSLSRGNKNIPYQVPSRIEGTVALSDTRDSLEYYKTYVDQAQNFILGPSAMAVITDADLGTSEEVEVPKGIRIDAKVVGYARDKDIVELQPTSGVGNLKSVSKILVPRSEVPPELLEGVTIKIGDKIVPMGEGKETGKGLVDIGL